jgi:prepilin-type processing-associated H-X9-DG protein
MMHREQDERLLIDFVLGQSEEAAAQEVEARLKEEEFSRLHKGVEATFALLNLLPPTEPPANLTERTMARVRAMRKTEALAAAPQLRVRAWTPRFSIHEMSALAAGLMLVIGIVLPSVRHAQRMATRTHCEANMAQIGTGLNQYAAENNDFLPPARLAANANWLTSKSGNSSALFQLVTNAAAKTDVFQCPGTPSQGFAYQAGMLDFPHPKAISYSYQHSIGKTIRRSAPEYAQAGKNMAILADATPAFRNGKFDPTTCRRNVVSSNHAQCGQNVLYLDGHVDWADTCRAGVDGNNIWIAEGIYDYKGDEKPAFPLDSFLLPNPGQ